MLSFYYSYKHLTLYDNHIIILNIINTFDVFDSRYRIYCIKYFKIFLKIFGLRYAKFIFIFFSIKTSLANTFISVFYKKLSANSFFYLFFLNNLMIRIDSFYHLKIQCFQLRLTLFSIRILVKFHYQ